MWYIMSVLIKDYIWDTLCQTHNKLELLINYMTWIKYCMICNIIKNQMRYQIFDILYQIDNLLKNSINYMNSYNKLKYQFIISIIIILW